VPKLGGDQPAHPKIAEIFMTKQEMLRMAQKIRQQRTEKKVDKIEKSEPR